MARARSSVNIEWFNVTYKSVYVTLLLLVGGLGGGVGYWYYFYIHQPKASAAGAISRAEHAYDEAVQVADDDSLQEIVESARVALDEARQAYGMARFSEARVNGIQSENLSLKALRQAGQSKGDSRMVRFYRLEGDVRVKRSGAFSWERADTNTVLRLGDQVKTSSSSSAQLIYFDGTITTIQTGSLMEIRELYEDPVTKVRRVKEKLNWGALKASTQKGNVAGSFHEVSTEKATARTSDTSDFRVSFDKKTRTAQFDAFKGPLEVASSNRRESLVGGETIRATGEGRLSSKQVLPNAPRLTTPRDQRVFIFENPLEETITLSWERLPGASKYNLVIANQSLFTDPAYDDVRESNTAVLEGVEPGSYFWKVAALGSGGRAGPFSSPRRFRVSSQKILDRGDVQPPILEITEFVPVGVMVIVNGRTEPGSTLWADDEKIDVFDDGTFYAVIRLRKEGLNELHFVAQDTAGNEARVVKSAYLEVF